MRLAIEARRVKQEARAAAIERGELVFEDPRDKIEREAKEAAAAAKAKALAAAGDKKGQPSRAERARAKKGLAPSTPVAVAPPATTPGEPGPSSPSSSSSGPEPPSDAAPPAVIRSITRAEQRWYTYQNSGDVRLEAFATREVFDDKIDRTAKLEALQLHGGTTTLFDAMAVHIRQRLAR